jgi:hypothetical protein
MDSQDCDPLRRIAGQVADCFAECGYAFIEDDKIEGLAALLESFLTIAGIPVALPGASDPAPEAVRAADESNHDTPRSRRRPRV